MAPVVSSAPFMPPTHRTHHHSDIFVFGDLTCTFEDDLRQLLHCRSNPVLQSFFDQVNVAFRREFALLPAEEQEWFPRFTDLVDLMANLEGTVGLPALRFSLLCVYQLGVFLNSDSYPNADNSHLVGICTGSFAAAAVSSSRSMNELPLVGIESVLAAFRTGLHSLRMQRDIRPTRDAKSQPWSHIFTLSEDKATTIVQEFSAKSNLPIILQPYISAVSPSTVTISGPPFVLDSLIDAYSLKAHPIPIQTPFHAAHLNGTEEVDEVLGALRHSKVGDYRPRFPMVSAESGELLVAEDFHGLLRQAVTETLCQQVRWDKICPALVSILANKESLTSCAVTPVASNAAPLLSSALQREFTHLAVTISNRLNSQSSKASPAQGKFQDSKIAIVGFSGRYPDSASNEELWKMLLTARDCHRTIPPDRFDWEAHYDPTGKKKNHSRVKFGCFINDPGAFDARFFNLSPREAENTDPAQRLALLSTYEAIEMAGLVPDRTPSTQRDRVGVIFGVTSDDWREVNSGQDVDTYFIPGGNRAFVPGRISYFFRFSGPSISVDTACSSSFAAISTACNYLWAGDCDTIIAGGTNVLTNPDNFVGLDRGHFLSTTGNCNPFDDTATGYCRADAVGSVILKRLEDAQADNDPIFGVIAGCSTNHCGQTVSITRPHEGDQLSLFRRILRHTNTDPTNVSYVEMHGTGTQAGDAAEMRSVLSAFAWDHQRSRVEPSRPLHLGGIKANVGHSESASGVTALIKVLMMMQNSLIPPHRLDGPLNRNYPDDLAERNVHIAFKATPWRREECPGQKRMAFLNNFSAAGGNTAVLLEDAPLHTPTSKTPLNTPSMWPVTVTAKSATALEANLQTLAEYLATHPETSLPSLSYTTTARRMHHKFRAVVTGTTISSIRTSLLGKANEGNFKAVKPMPPKVAFVFTGQGSLYFGMGRSLFQQVTMFRSDIIRFERIARRYGFPSFLPLVSGEGSQAQAEALTADPVVSHLAITCIQMALSHIWTLWSGSTPCAVVGHSLGEYAGLYAAGVLSASDVIYLVGKRAQLLSKYCSKGSHSMLAVKAPIAAVTSTLANTACTVACINSPTSTVVSGPVEEIRELSTSFKQRNIDTVQLDIPYAFHSAQVDPLLAEFAHLANAVPFRTPTVPYLSPLLSQTIHGSGILNASYLAQSSRECVNFQGAIQTAYDAKIVDNNTIWLEMGAHPACSGMIKQTFGSGAITICSLRKDVDAWKVLTDSMEVLYKSGADVQWNELHRNWPATHEVLPLPSYKWDLKNYWIQYRHNFCLTKGDDPATFATRVAPAPEQQPPQYLSSSVHRVLEETSSTETSTLLTESDLHDPRLFPIVSGHKVNTAMLCPSSLYADMALTIAKRMLQSNGMMNDSLGLDCSTMSIQRPLIAQPNSSSQLLRVSATVTWSTKNISLKFFSVDANGRKLADHASCTVQITEKQNWLQEWKRNTYLIASRISSLRKDADTGNAHKLKRGLAYRLFSTLVDYGSQYQGMEQVILDSEQLEATSEVKFQVDSQGFDWNPCWIDSLGHIAGFIMNGSDHVYSKDQVFINHGWESMRCAKPIEADKSYTSYNRMQLESGTMYVGDTYIFEGQQLVAIFSGVRFQGVNRSVLDHLLPSKSRALPVPKTASKPAPPPQANRSMPTPTQAKTKSAAPVPKALSIQQPPRTGPGKAAGVMRIILDEAQIDEDDIDLDAPFTDLGIDSLLSLTIISRLQDECGIEIPSSAFVDYPTIKAFISFTAGEVSPWSSSSAQSQISPTPSTADGDVEDCSTDATSVDGDDDLYSDKVDIMAIIRSVISEETGTPVEDITSNLPLAELGLDSLLSLTIMGTLAEKIDTELPSSIFADSETLSDIETALRHAGIITGPNMSEVRSPEQEEITGEISTSSTVCLIDYDELSTAPHATSVLLQGSPKTARTKLFLFPDGAGSATTYNTLGNVSPDVVVYGLNCPWLKTPEDMKCSLEHYVAKLIVELRRRQPHGPYYVGGLSAGGILAYEAAQQLARSGETVAKLVLLDSPNPIGLENPNQRFYDFIESLGLFGSMNKNKAPKWLRPHFDAFLVMLDAYKVQKFATMSPPETHIIYARDGMCKHESDPRPEIRPDDPREMLWLLNNRTDFSASGWGALLGKNSLRVAVLDNVNHYTILQSGPSMEKLCALVARSLEA